ncbi:uncharacterized protein G2W53_010402 [Senna tora]|uniref:Uncharacterized protein n=1 Tax=Senna tora TaxID=362788 RepID=A0A834X0Y9_9FABA|nr:uncharacterized protein G2W53_010402 [Senna tora]
MSFKKVGGKWIQLGEAKAEPGEESEKKKMNVKHGRRPPKSTKGPGTQTSSRLLKKPPMTPLAKIREQLKNLTIQLTSAREEIYELKMITIEMKA